MPHTHFSHYSHVVVWETHHVLWIFIHVVGHILNVTKRCSCSIHNEVWLMVAGLLNSLVDHMFEVRPTYGSIRDYFLIPSAHFPDFNGLGKLVLRKVCPYSSLVQQSRKNLACKSPPSQQQSFLGVKSCQVLLSRYNGFLISATCFAIYFHVLFVLFV